MAKIKLSLNSRAHNKSDARYLAKGWQNTWLTPGELASWVKSGKAWCGTHLAENRRSQANARGSNAIVMDMDGELSLADFWSTETAQQWCCLTYTSSSSTPEVNRFRAVFLLDALPLNSAWEHKTVYAFIADKLKAELGITFKDDCGEKPERLWYGNTQTQIILHPDACVPSEVVDAIDIPDEPTYEFQRVEGITDIDIMRCRWLLDHFLDTSEDGEYNDIYLPVMFACAGIGDQVADCWSNWVMRGHHGSNPQNADPAYKWRSVQSRSGPASLYKLAKKQDPYWASKLPFELRFSTNRQQTTTLDAILSQGMRCVPASIFA